MVWIKSLENNYVNADNIISITFDYKCNSFVAVVGYKDIRLQHPIYQHKVLDNILQGEVPKSETEIIEKIISHIGYATRKDSIDILDFQKLLED
jgi:hypothetical protein